MLQNSVRKELFLNMHRHVLILICLLPFALPGQSQWNIQDSHTTADLHGIRNVGRGVAWASGTNGTVLHTEDAGNLWQICAVPPGAEKLDFRGIYAFDENTAIVMSSGKGNLSRLYKTSDGCKTWKLVFANPDEEGDWSSINFVGKANGIILGNPVNGRFVIFETEDGGLHWNRQKSTGAGAVLGGVVFAVSNSSLVQQDGRQVFGIGGPQGSFVYFRGIGTIKCLQETQDQDPNACNAWNATRLPLGARMPVRSGIDSAGVFSLAIRPGPTISKSVLVAVGGDFRKPDKQSDTSATSISGGRLWIAARTPPHGYRSSVAYDEKTRTWITVGLNGTDISTDDGKNWRALLPEPDELVDSDKNWNALSLPFVVGPNGRIGKRR
jgi:photosystem II stability/assembly factor-like uncharacterized protein